MVVNVEFAREACGRLPLGEATLRLLDVVMEEEFLSGVFERRRGRSYEKVISFPTFVRLIAAPLLENHDSARQSFPGAQEAGVLEAPLPAAYGKLARLPICLSKGLLADASARLQEIFPDS